jgi:hypothetical protein
MPISIPPLTPSHQGRGNYEANYLCTSNQETDHQVCPYKTPISFPKSSKFKVQSSRFKVIDCEFKEFFISYGRAKGPGATVKGKSGTHH